MKIEFGVQEYFNELKLMDAQYGQEEELYPWIYMLLQMAECRKKEILKEWYQEVSIRDVHRAVKTQKDNEIKLKLIEKRGAPDIVILNMKKYSYKNQFGGCVEVKKLGDNLKIKEGQGYSKEDLKRKNIEATYRFNLKNIENVKAFSRQIKKKLGEKLKIDESKVNYRGSWANGPLHTFEVILDKDLDNIELGKINMETSIKIDEKNIIYYLAREKENWECKEKHGWFDEQQIISHLEKFKKVLYTNGLEFYYLVLDEKKIDVKKIADLQPMYADFKESSTPSPQLLLEASTEWDRLIAGLTSIDWHLPPVAEIPSTQTNTGVNHVRD